MIHNLRTIYVIYNRRKISTYKYKHKINIASEKNIQTQRLFEGKPFEIVFFRFFRIVWYSTVSIYPAKKF